MKKSICIMLCAVILSSTMTVHAYAPEEQHTISYRDGSFAEVNGTEEYTKDQENFVIGSKTYIYYNWDGTIAFTYTVKASFVFDGKQAKPNGCYTSFYVSDGWEKLEDNFGRSTGTAVFSNGSKQRKIHLSIACRQDGKIS